MKRKVEPCPACGTSTPPRIGFAGIHLCRKCPCILPREAWAGLSLADQAAKTRFAWDAWRKSHPGSSWQCKEGNKIYDKMVAARTEYAKAKKAQEIPADLLPVHVEFFPVIIAALRAAMARMKAFYCRMTLWR